jgi:small-conductance mechanosensitive channel
MKILIRVFLILSLVASYSKSSAIVQDTLQQAPAALVIHHNDTIFYIYESLGPYKPSERASIVEQRLNNLLEDPDFRIDSLLLHEGERTTDILFKDRIILSVTEGDAKPWAQPRNAVARQTLARLKEVLGQEKISKSILNILLQIGLTLLELLILYLLIKYLNRLFNYTKKRIINAREKILKGIHIKGYELLDTKRELQVALFLNNILRWAVIVIVLYLAIPILFSIFPWTRGLADKLFSYILSPVRNIFFSIINFIPNLFAIAVIYLATRYTIKFFKFLASEIASGALVISGFYPDWAMPTFNIVKVLLYAFMFVVIFPYLPGSDSPVFQGVSVFLGILFSLGSSSAISNAVAGLVITYMRPFKIGDRIKIGEITGDVIEKSLLVTRIRTVKNEEITIPNAAVLSGHTVNYTTSAKELGLILHTGVTIGYDAPWKKVHEVLINAALATRGIIKDESRKPFVLQTSLDDFYVSYQINAFTDESSRMAAIYSELHQNIQDKFNEADIEILSPHYRAQRDGNPIAVPASYLPGDYKPPSFNVSVNKSNATDDEKEQ